MLELKIKCKECNKKVIKTNKNQLYCSNKCKKKHYLDEKKKRVMSKLCPKCRKNYCYVGSKGCQECHKIGKHSTLSRSLSHSKYRSKIKNAKKR
jgi:hypothetical protein